MKKIAIGAGIVFLLAVGGVGAYLVFNNPSDGGSPLAPSTSNSNNNEDGSSSGNVTFVSIDACDILTEDIAKQAVGNDIDKTSTAANSASTTDIFMSSCNYQTNITSSDGSSVPKINGANLLVRVAKTPAGAESNKVQFRSKGTDVQVVQGLGDDAFYNPSFKQLHVLKGNNWYVIMAYKDSIMNSSLASGKALAQKLDFR